MKTDAQPKISFGPGLVYASIKVRKICGVVENHDQINSRRAKSCRDLRVGPRTASTDNATILLMCCR